MAITCSKSEIIGSWNSRHFEHSMVFGGVLEKSCINQPFVRTVYFRAIPLFLFCTISSRPQSVSRIEYVQYII